MGIHYILIDYENVQPETLLGLDTGDFNVRLFVGANQSRMRTEVAMAMQKLGARAEYIGIAGNGPNALDFHIAYYIGYLSVRDPSGQFHIISKDKGFDPLIDHLMTRGVVVSRSKSVQEVLAFGAPESKAAADRLAKVLDNLAKLASRSRPKKLKTLSSAITALFKNDPLGEGELDWILAQLQERSYVTTKDGAVSYELSK